MWSSTGASVPQTCPQLRLYRPPLSRNRFVRRSAHHTKKCSYDSSQISSTAVACRPGLHTLLEGALTSRSCNPLNSSLDTPRVAAVRHAGTCNATGAAASASSSSTGCTGRALVVGGGPAGLAAAIGLARQAGFRVDVFDSRPHPAADMQASREALLVALGGWSLECPTRHRTSFQLLDRL